MDDKERDLKRQELRHRVDAAIDSADDPLAEYDHFVKWTIKNYPPGSRDSGLVELLHETTQNFRNDQVYKSDLRYLKLWALYARHVSKPVKVYQSLVADKIGTSYALLYEEYANALERENRIADAEKIYALGISKSARPLERLKKRYSEFHTRTQQHSSNISDFSTSGQYSSSTYGPYAAMLAPPVPGQRQERIRMNLSLLFTPESGEFCAAEARAASLGLLRKKWESLVPISSSVIPSSGVVDGREIKPLPYSRRKSLMYSEPTVTINTKEALQDVFGMYNSPEKTTKIYSGSKHAPTKRIEPMTPVVSQQARTQPLLMEGGSGGTAVFKPFVDENAPHMDAATPKIATSLTDMEKSRPSRPAFVPFRDENAPTFKTPDTRRGLALSDSVKSENAQGSVFKARAPLASEGGGAVFSKVFTPARAPGDVPQDPSAPSLLSSQTPFKVFSRPPVATPTPGGGSFQPFVDAPTETLPRLPDVAEEPEVDPASSEESEQDHYAEDAFDEIKEQRGRSPYDTHDASFETSEDSDKQSSPSEIPSGIPYDEDYTEEVRSHRTLEWGGRFGNVNIMTPITERTIEYTTSVYESLDTLNNPLGQSYLGNFRVNNRRRSSTEPQDEFESDEYEGAVISRQPEHHVNEGWDDESFQDDPIEPSQIDTNNLENQMEVLRLSSSFHPTNPCNPLDETIISALLSMIPSEPNFYDSKDRDANHLEGLQKHARKYSRQSSGSGVDDLPGFGLELHGSGFRVYGKLGEGGFGSVFTAEMLHHLDDEDETETFGELDECGSVLVALKVVRPRDVWEYHVLRRLRATLDNRLKKSIVLPQRLHAFRDESYLVLELSPHGSLLDLVNRAGSSGVAQQGACLDELLAFFFTIELLRVVEGMHRNGFIHGDLKIDNCLLRLEEVPAGASTWMTDYRPSGEGGWAYKGLRIVDFGRSIDTRLFPPEQEFSADWPVDDKDCFEMREGRPWTYEPDYFGTAGIVYCMLFGKHMQASAITLTPESRQKVSTPMKRYWQQDLWSSLFDMLLNPKLTAERHQGHLPICDEVCQIRLKMEGWLVKNCNRTSGTLKGLLKKIEKSLLQ